MFSSLVGSALHVPSDRIEGLLELYGQELYGDKYKPVFFEKLRKEKQEKLRAKLTDNSLLNKVGKMTVPDKDLPPIPKKRRRRR